MPSSTASLKTLDDTPLDSLPRTRQLPSGRSVVVKLAGTHEEVEIRSASGAVEVVIALTENGPVVRLQGGRLELDTPDELAVSCRRLAIHSREETQLSSDGTIRMTGRDMFVKTTEVTDFKAAPICLNVKDEVRAAKWPPPAAAETQEPS